ncbi:molybdopterin-dependent oxidoreductase [Aliikangiella sp. G2MR2-5]|uniref:molybdopterin-dependent oxidoreductase n=1 Tax=Aliikangiella sp. G2MR2-5 TaxID=2788943 RepID=UPI0018AAE2B9|nr:molybdopterin-dependent oxidoreductase [Aliikangiella sp. G2MR2-5]
MQGYRCDYPVRTTCPYCGVGCGIEISGGPDGKLSLSGDKSHPANFGKLCTKGRNLLSTLDGNARIHQPYTPTGNLQWSKAIAYVASQLNQTIDKHGPDSIAFYVSGQLLTEDYYIANKLMKGFIGSANIDTNSRLCMSSPALAQKKAYGSDTVVPDYQDIEQAELVLLVGSNLAWCHPVLYQRLKESKIANPKKKIILIDPRITPCIEITDLHLAINPGTDLLLFNSLLGFLHQHGLACNDYFSPDIQKGAIEYAVTDFRNIRRLIDETGISLEQLHYFWKLFANTEKVVTIFSQGVNQSSVAVDTASAIINCHLYTNRIARIGMGPFPVTGQPNAMGGREVGAMATSLAGHLDYNEENLNWLSSFWQSHQLPRSPGLKAVEIFEGILKGKVKALWIMATNPLVSLPDTQLVKKALNACEFVVVNEVFQSSETLAYADLVLPAQGWGEKSGTVTNSERRLSRQRAFMEPVGEAKPDWWIICEVAKAMGFSKAFNYSNVAQIFNEHITLLNESYPLTGSIALKPLQDLTSEHYDRMVPVQWPQTDNQSIVLGGQSALFDCRFHTRSKRPEMIAVNYWRSVEDLNSNKVSLLSQSHLTSSKTKPGFILNSGRIRDQWHTMTRTELATELNHHVVEACVSMHPIDAAENKINDASFVELSSFQKSMIIRANYSYEVARGQLFIPMHFANNHLSSGGVNQLVDRQCDPQSGQPAFKQSRVSIKPVNMQSEATLVSPFFFEELPFHYWYRIKIRGGYRYSLALEETIDEAYKKLYCWLMGRTYLHSFEENRTRQLLRGEGKRLQNASENRSIIRQGKYSEKVRRLAILEEGSLLAAFQIGQVGNKVSTPWMDSLLEGPLTLSQKAALVAGSSELKEINRDYLCLCAKVSRSYIEHEIKSLDSITCAKEEKNKEQLLEEVIRTTGAGKGCGSCIAEISMALSLNNEQSRTALNLRESSSG